jgi:ubiquinone/menaquinone biosynthesis C-methylase UbiE
LEDGTVDTVVSTFTLCTIPGIGDAIRGIARILKSTGNLISFELGLSPDPEAQRREKQLEPLYHWLFRGLYLVRDIPAYSVQGGFQIEQLETGYMPNLRSPYLIVGRDLEFRARGRDQLRHS